MDHVAAKIDKELRAKYKGLFLEDSLRIAGRVISRVVDDLENGGLRRTGRTVFEVENELAVTFDRLCKGNQAMRDHLVERFLREEMERL